MLYASFLHSSIACMLVMVLSIIWILRCKYLSLVCRWLVSKEIDASTCDAMSILATEVVCKFQKAFPPSFFDCQIHLLVHLPREVKLCGPVHTRWMFFLERFLGYLKGLRQNSAHIKGSISEGRIQAETMFHYKNVIQQMTPQCQELWLKSNEERANEANRGWVLMGASNKKLMNPVQYLQVCTKFNSNLLWCLKFEYQFKPWPPNNCNFRDRVTFHSNITNLYASFIYIYIYEALNINIMLSYGFHALLFLWYQY